MKTILMRQFIPLDDIERIAESLASDARRCGDLAGADGIELLVDELRHAVNVTLYQIEERSIASTRNGDGR